MLTRREIEVFSFARSCTLSNLYLVNDLTSGQTRTKKGRTGAGRSIKIKPEAEKTVKEAGNRTVKTAPRMAESFPGFFSKGENPGTLQKSRHSNP